MIHQNTTSIKLSDVGANNLITAILQQACLDAMGLGYKLRGEDPDQVQCEARNFLEAAGINADMQRRILIGMDQHGTAKRQQIQEKEPRIAKNNR